MKSFYTSTLIDASPTRVWEILVEIDRWVEWNTTIDKTVGSSRLEAANALGRKITLYVKASPGRPFPLTVTEFVPPRQMTWVGGMPFGLFAGTRTFTLSAHADDKTLFEMTEEYSGLLARFITRSIPDLQPAFNEFAHCLKAVAEGTPTPK